MKWRNDIDIDVDPAAAKDYQFDWSDWLGTDTISTYTLTPETGITVSSESNTDTAVVGWVQVASTVTSARLRCHIVTAGGREDTRSIHFTAEEQ